MRASQAGGGRPPAVAGASALLFSSTGPELLFWGSFLARRYPGLSFLQPPKPS